MDKSGLTANFVAGNTDKEQALSADITHLTRTTRIISTTIFPKKNHLQTTLFLFLLLAFIKYFLNLQRQCSLCASIMPAAGGMTIHNTKASSMLCLLASWNLKIPSYQSKDICRVKCYGYAWIVSRSVPWGYIISSSTLFGMCMQQYRVGWRSIRSLVRVF